MPHTYAVLEVSPSAYAEILAKIEEAGYQHAVHEHQLIDMQGIAIQCKAGNVVKDDDGNYILWSKA